MSQSSWSSDRPLTPRQREVATLIARGCTNVEIAQRLTITPGTVANHVEDILRALGVRNRAQIAAWTVQQDHDQWCVQAG